MVQQLLQRSFYTHCSANVKQTHHARQPELITSVVTLVNNNAQFHCSNMSANWNNTSSGSLALRRLFLAVQLLQRLEFADQCLVLVLQQSHAILQTSHIVLLFPATLFCCFSESTQYDDNNHNQKALTECKLGTCKSAVCVRIESRIRH